LERLEGTGPDRKNGKGTKGLVVFCDREKKNGEKKRRFEGKERGEWDLFGHQAGGGKKTMALMGRTRPVEHERNAGAKKNKRGIGNVGRGQSRFRVMAGENSPKDLKKRLLG